jgi:hypothetical protein
MLSENCLHLSGASRETTPPFVRPVMSFRRSKMSCDISAKSVDYFVLSVGDKFRRHPVRLSQRTVLRILFCCCTAKARFPGNGRGWLPAHAWIAATDSKGGGEWRDVSFWSHQSSPQIRVKDFLAESAARLGIRASEEIVWRMNHQTHP